MSRLNVDIDTARKNLNSHDWVAVSIEDSLCKICNASILNVDLVLGCYVPEPPNNYGWVTEWEEEDKS
jgi:hypothetical protein